MSTWQLYLRSKIFGQEYDNIAGAIGEAERVYRSFYYENVARKLEMMSRDNDLRFVVTETSEGPLIGAYGLVGAVLGPDHLQAWDRKRGKTSGGRKKPFFLGFTAPKGTPPPTSVDLDAIRAKLPSTLLEMFAEAEKNSPYFKRSRSFTMELPASTPIVGNAWDETVQAIRDGRSTLGKAMHYHCNSGAVSVEEVKARTSILAEEPAIPPQAESTADKKKLPTATRGERPGDRQLLRWGGAIAGIGAISHGCYGIYSTLADTSRNPEPLTPRNGIDRKQSGSDRSWTKLVTSGAEIAAGSALAAYSLRR